MSGRVQARFCKGVFYECLICQSFKCCTGFGYNDEKRVSKIYRCKNSSCIIRVNVADELRFHLECVIGLRPVLQCDVKSTGTKVTSADTNLNDCGEFLTSFVGDLTSMNLICKISSFFLLGNVEFSLVHTVNNNRLAKLCTCKMMKDHTFLACVDHCAVI